MTSKAALKVLFSTIIVVMVACTAWATSHQSILEWSGLTSDPGRCWTIATLFDAYFGFLTFYVWVLYKERRLLARVLWFIAIMTLGNMAMASYVLWQLFKLSPGEPVARILSDRTPSEVSS